MCSDLLEDGVEVEIMWIPAHVKLEANEIMNERARHAALHVSVFERSLPPVDFQGLARFVLQETLDSADTGQFTHSIIPKISLRPWFQSQKEDGKFVLTVSRIMSDNHT
jgi:hypothetical protein